MSCSLWLGLSQEPRFFHVVVSHHVRTDLVQDMTTLRTRSRHSRTPRGSNDIQYQMAQFHCGTHVPDERARVSRETHPDEIDFEDPMIAQAERVHSRELEISSPTYPDIQTYPPHTGMFVHQRRMLWTTTIRGRHRSHISTDVHSGQPPTPNTTTHSLTTTSCYQSVLSQF